MERSGVHGTPSEVEGDIDGLVIATRLHDLVWREDLSCAKAFGESCFRGYARSRIDGVSEAARKLDERGRDATA